MITDAATSGRPLRRLCRCGRFALAAFLLLTLILTACGGRAEPATDPLPPSAQQGKTAPSGQAGPSGKAQASGQSAPAGKSAPAGQPSAKRAGDTAQKSAGGIARQMLTRAGRNPAAAQPEPGFVLAVPDSVGDGEAFAVAFGAQGAKGMTLHWRGSDLHVRSDSAANGPMRALLPVPLDEKAKKLPLTLTVHWQNGRNERFQADLPVHKRKYPVQRLKVDQKYVSPPPGVQDKIKRDRAELRAAVSKITPNRYWNLPLERPVPGEVTSLYGMRRVFNGQPKSPHKGVDFDARQGDPIAALEDGVVVLVSEHYYGGNTVLVDHGLGVLSAYLHLSAFDVTVGQKVRRGQIVGRIGSTGRVTGPHLHLSLYVLGQSINAAPCLGM